MVAAIKQAISSLLLLFEVADWVDWVPILEVNGTVLTVKRVATFTIESSRLSWLLRCWDHILAHKRTLIAYSVQIASN